ncbi:MAG: hypothetical protein O3A14_06935 [Cyanobacteria bacterium]|nr:hypothetical protein [Cyanobacteriota bacterium]
MYCQGGWLYKLCLEQGFLEQRCCQEASHRVRQVDTGEGQLVFGVEQHQSQEYPPQILFLEE